MNPLAFHVAEHVARLKAWVPPMLEGPCHAQGATFWILHCQCPLCLGPRMMVYTKGVATPWLAACTWCGAVLACRRVGVTPVMLESLFLPDGVPVPLNTSDLARPEMQMAAERALAEMDASLPWEIRIFGEIAFWIKCAMSALRPFDAEAQADLLVVAQQNLGVRHLKAIRHPTPAAKFGRGAQECWSVDNLGDLKVDCQVAVEIMTSGSPPGLPLDAGRYWHVSVGKHGTPLSQMSDVQVGVMTEYAKSLLAPVGDGPFLALPSMGAIHLFRRMTETEGKLVGSPSSGGRLPS